MTRLHVWFHHIVTLHCVLLGEMVGCCGTDVLHVGSETDGVFASSGLPGLGALVIGCQIVEGEFHGECLTLVGLELTCLGKGFQFASGFFQTAGRSADVEFYDLFACPLACVGDGDRGGETIFGGFDDGLAIGEGCIAQAETEGVRNGFLGGGEVAIAYVDAFYVFGVILKFHLLVTASATRSRRTYVGEVGTGWQVDEVVGPCHGEFSRRIGLAGQHVSYRIAALLSWLPRQKDGIGHRLPRGRLDDIAHIEYDDHGFFGQMESITYICDELALYIFEGEVTILLTVGALSSLTA